MASACGRMNISFHKRISVWKLHFALILASFHSATALHLGQTANLNSTWMNVYDPATGFNGSTGLMRPILVSNNNVSGQRSACGFFSSFQEKYFVFGVVIAYYTTSLELVEEELVWQANRNKPVNDNATVQLTLKGELILRDADGTLVWSTNTAGKSVAALNMTESGNLILSDVNDSVVWQSFDDPTYTFLQDQFSVRANLTSTWMNIYDPASGFNGSAGQMRPILMSNIYASLPSYACGFFSSFQEKYFVFGVVIADYTRSPEPELELVWHANRNKPVNDNATVQFTSEGELILRDADGTLVWSSNTTGKSVAALKMTRSGNLILSDVNNSVVWQSFDHPTDTLVQDQVFVPGQELRAIVSDSNWTQGLYSLSLTKGGASLYASVNTNPPQIYYKYEFWNREGRHLQFQNGSLGLAIQGKSPSSSFQFLRLTNDGHLKVYEYNSHRIPVDDLLTPYLPLGECSYPSVCGRYGICSDDKQCSCPPGSNYFKPISEVHPNQGCSAVTSLNCNASEYQSFITLKDVSFSFIRSDIKDTDVDSCREACLRNCSCNAAVFYRMYTATGVSEKGSCYLVTNDIFSLVRDGRNLLSYVATTFIKVQNVPNLTSRERTNQPLKVGIGVGCFTFIVIIGVLIMVVWRKRHIVENEEDYLDLIPGMPSRFSYEELKIATENFTTKLGQGGFGSVFEGILRDGTKVAVKCLNGIGQVKKSFLAEVESIGSIHHVNLVRLVGFCAENTHRLLVYEYMAKGSMDRWIYHGSERVILDWECRRKIIQEISRGLAYLHEECRHKILHLDIKPQNILLDEDYSAKLADFGLAKLIDRKQSKIVTTMRGTPGYLAPEWLSGIVTEKVDVYSFGVVLLELLCGRKHYDESEPEECRHLISIFKVKAEEGQLSDLIDKHSEDMKLHGVEVEKMMRVAGWCLMSDSKRRPSMSMVVKVLEGAMEVETDLNYNLLLNSTPESIDQNRVADSTPLNPSILTGPR